MTDPSQALLQLHDHAAQFLRDGSERLLHVLTDAPLRSAVLELLTSLEQSRHATGPFVVFDAPHDAADPGWHARAMALRHHHQLRRKAAGVHQNRWPSLGHEPLPPGLAGFAQVLGQLPASTPDARPWVVILAPEHVHASTHWSRALAMLLRGSALGALRWVVVDTERPSLSRVTDTPEEVRQVDVRSQASDLVERLAAPRASGGPGAGPSGVTPPPRRGREPTPSRPSLGQEVARRLLAAHQAQRAGAPTDALHPLGEARALCHQAGPNTDAVVVELMLGTHLLAAGSPAHAVACGQRAIELARALGEASPLLPTAWLAAGSFHLTAREPARALAAYQHAAEAAAPTSMSTLAVEAHRLAGHVALQLDQPGVAHEHWLRAVSLAERDPSPSCQQGAALAARAAANLCRRSGLQRTADDHDAAASALASPRAAMGSDDFTAQLTPQEILAPHRPVPPPRATRRTDATEQLDRSDAASSRDPTDPELGGTAWIPQQLLAQIRARFGHAPDPSTVEAPPAVQQPPPRPIPAASPTGPGDRTSMLTREELQRLARRHAQRSRRQQ